MTDYFTIKWSDGTVRMIDQRLLPQYEVYRDYTDYREISEAIKSMVIRGAPAIGAAAGFGLALAAIRSKETQVDKYVQELKSAANVLANARPTAVNLSWALNRIINKIENISFNHVTDICEVVVAEALEIAEEDIRTNKQIAMNGLSIVPDVANIFHHCNTGSLATVGYGTALGVIRFAHESGKKIHVYVDETRPRFQGARLTAWELGKLEIPYTIVVDGASGFVMRTEKVDLCLVGCDRIAANGDVANKIGTYNLAIAAKAHGVPFYSVGPTSTIDLKTPTGNDIPIEQREPDEVTHIGDSVIAPIGAKVLNPAFDVTPHSYVSGIITERGIARPPYIQNLEKLFS
jgi:methylthioribose-1-phosphate isomerase